MQLLLRSNTLCRAPLSRLPKLANLNPYAKLAQQCALNVIPASSFATCPPDSTCCPKKNKSWLSKLYGKESLIAKESFDKPIIMFIPALLTHVSIGAVWAWSFVSSNIIKEYGFVAQAAEDWSMKLASLPMSFIFGAFGISGALLGTLLLKMGPRKSVGLAALSYATGFCLGAIGIHTHHIELLTMGFGIFGGVGVGMSYTPSIQTLMKWYPHQVGMASGLTIAGFGLSPLLFTPLMQWLMKRFVKLPEYLGTIHEVATQNQAGRLFAQVGNQLKEVVIATQSDLAQIPYKSLAEGVYVVGSGNTGAALAFGIMGLIYGGLIGASSLIFKYPHPNVEKKYKLMAQKLLEEKFKSGGARQRGNVPTTTALLSPQFLLMYSIFVMYGGTGMALFSSCKPLMNEIFSAKLPHIVDAQFASTFISVLSIGSVLGRIFWAGLSEKIGRKNALLIQSSVALACFASVPTIIKMLVNSTSSLPLWMFIAATTIISSCQGGTYSIVPAFEADLFGNKYLTPIHGFMLTNVIITSFLGPTFMQMLRSKSEAAAIQSLLPQVDKDKFVTMFKCGVEHVDELIKSKTLTIPKLMSVVPKGVQDPSPFLYNASWYTMCGMIALTIVAASGIFPVNPKYYEDKKKPGVNQPAPKPATAAPQPAKKTEKKQN